MHLKRTQSVPRHSWQPSKRTASFRSYLRPVPTNGELSWEPRERRSKCYLPNPARRLIAARRPHNLAQLRAQALTCVREPSVLSKMSGDAMFFSHPPTPVGQLGRSDAPRVSEIVLNMSLQQHVLCNKQCALSGLDRVSGGERPMREAVSDAV